MKFKIQSSKLKKNLKGQALDPIEVMSTGRPWFGSLNFF
jgi:hypothetical protein